MATEIQVVIGKAKQITKKTKDEVISTIKGTSKSYVSGTFQGVYCTGFVNNNKTTITVYSVKKELGMWHAKVYDISLNSSLFKAVKQNTRDFVIECASGVSVRIENSR